MDPITAAGIGLSVTSLALQVFSGCIKGYEMFIEVVDMPAEYEHLRTRLRIEQSRCLLWGDQVGLAEDLLDRPSKTLQLSSNLILDILHQVQVSFRSCFDLTHQFDQITNKGLSKPVSQNYASTKRGRALLQKTLAVWEKSGRVAGRVEWAMIKKGDFERLVTRLIQYNDRIESLLDRATLEELRAMQDRSNFTLLQMAKQLNDVRNLVQAMQVNHGDDDLSGISTTFSRASTLREVDDRDNGPVLSLAVFKSHQLRIQMQPAPGKCLLIQPDEILFDSTPKFVGRQFATMKGRTVWIEWRESVDEALAQSRYRETTEQRVEELAAILAAPDKPIHFRSPTCSGFYRSEHKDKPRYGLVYSWPPDVGSSAPELVSLRELLTGVKRTPDLNTRIQIAQMLAESLLYLHTVDWIHKDIRSSNILFLSNAKEPIDLTRPMLSGFDFSRPALPDAMTVSHQFSTEHDLYRHPDLLRENAGRSKKSHDIYSLGLVLAELAMWQPIEELTQIELRRSKLNLVRVQILGEKPDVLAAIDQRAGWTYSDIVQCCVKGGSALGLAPGADEEDAPVAADLSDALHQKVVRKLQAIKI